MEANEAQELQEHAEHGAHESAMRPVAFTMSVLAVLVAVTTVLGHRAHTDAVLSQAMASDQWNEYQAKKIRAADTGLAADLLSALTVGNNPAAQKDLRAYADHQAKWTADLAEDQEKAKAFEERVELAEHKANRFDLSEALLEIGLVVTSVTLLTKTRGYWYLGMVFAAGGVVAAVLGLLAR